MNLNYYQPPESKKATHGVLNCTGWKFGDGLIDSSFRLLSNPSGQPEGCPNSAGAVFVERWFFPDEPTKQIKKPPYG